MGQKTNELSPSNRPSLIINTSGVNSGLSLWRGDDPSYQSLGDDSELSSALLIKIDQLLKKHHHTVNDLEAVIVATGPGRFTAIKVGLAVANALAWSVGCSIYGVTTDQLPESAEDINRIMHQPNRLAKPTLGPPNITLPTPKPVPLTSDELF